MAKKPASRPRKMTKEVFYHILDEIECNHLGIKTLAKKYKSSSTAFYNMMDADKSGNLADLYARAKERQADYLFQLQMEIVMKRDEDHTPFTGANVIQRDRLIADTIKWQAGKLRPKKYGDKIDVEAKVEVTEVRFDFDVIKPKGDAD